MSRNGGGTRQQGKPIEEVVRYALAHPIRIKTLVILNEGVYSVDQIAELIGESTGKVAHHVKELLAAGSIELARTEMVRNALAHYYRAVEMAYFTDEEFRHMTHQERQVIFGLTLQCQFAEAMDSFCAGTISSDPRAWLTNRRFTVDQEGREAFANEQERSWLRLQEIEAESVNRVAKSGEPTQTLMGGQLGYSRARPGPKVFRADSE